MHKLIIKDLTVSIEDKVILKDFNLEIKSGEIHAIMGPNGTGKSTLSKVIMGDSKYKILSGTIEYDGISLNDLTVDERARLGLFLGMQLPTEISGVTNADFMKTALHAKEKEKFKLFDFIKKMDKTCVDLKMNKDMIHRSLNVGFSGGEKKKNEILQMYMLNPSMIILDEIDSGLDVDSLKIVGESVMKYYKENDCALLIITHYQRLLDYIKPNKVHIMSNGKIIKSGEASIVSEIEKKGYEKIKEEISYNNIGE